MDIGVKSWALDEPTYLGLAFKQTKNPYMILGFPSTSDSVKFGMLGGEGFGRGGQYKPPTRVEAF